MSVTINEGPSFYKSEAERLRELREEDPAAWLRVMDRRDKVNHSEFCGALADALAAERRATIERIKSQVPGWYLHGRLTNKGQIDQLVRILDELGSE